MICAYKLTTDLGDGLKEGEVVHLEQEKGDKLVEAGLAEEAQEEDMGAKDGAEEGAGDEMPLVENAIAKVKDTVEKAENQAAEKLARAMSRTRPQPENVLPAEIKEKTYRSPGAAIAGIIKAMYGKDEAARKREQNRVMAYQDECVKAYDKMGLVTKSPLGVNEGTNSQGGYLVNTQFSPDVYAIPHTQLDLQGLCEVVNAQSLTYSQRYINESSLVNGSIFGGLNMVATAEGASFTSSLPAWNNLSLTLQKEAIFVYETSEILEDASYPLESELNEYTAKAFLYGINSQIVQGTTLEGLLNAPSLVTVTSSSNDTAYHTTPTTALTYADLVAMFARVYPDSQTSPKGIWLFHPLLESALMSMTYTFSGSTPAWGISYDAQNGLAGNGPGAEGVGTPFRIFGKPAYPHFSCSAPGTAGDIIYVDFATVLHYKRPFRVEVSRDYQFGTDQIAVRFVWRGDVKTRFRSAITPPTGTTTLSAIVTRSASGT